MAVVFALQASVAVADTWIALKPAGVQVGNSVLASDPFAPDTLYADAYSVTSIVKSTDGGKTWNVVMPYSRSEVLEKIVVEQNAPNRVTALTLDSDIIIYRSTNGGTTWSRSHVSSPVTGIVWDIAVDPVDTNKLYTVHERICLTANSCVRDSGGISKSVDGGRHWTALLKDTNVEQVVIDPFGSGTVYAGSDWGGWRRSTNGGATWTSFDVSGESIFRIALDPVVPDVLYASTFSGLWRSDDRGDTWHKLGNPLAFGPAWSIAIDPAHREVIVAGGGGSQGASRSLDGGESWTPLNDGLTGSPLAPSQLAWIRVFFATNGKLYGAADLFGAMMLQTQPPPRSRSVRH